MSNSNQNFNTEIKYFKMDSLRLGKLPQIKSSLAYKGVNIDTEPWVLVEKFTEATVLSCISFRMVCQPINWHVVTA